MDWLSVIPPIVAIAVVLWRKEVIAALLLGIFASELLQLAFVWYSPGAATINTVERVVGVFNSPDNTRILIFSLMIGALLALRRSTASLTRALQKTANTPLCSRVQSVVSFLSSRTLASCQPESWRVACSTGSV
jgi:hypothetical protein